MINVSKKYVFSVLVIIIIIIIINFYQKNCLLYFASKVVLLESLSLVNVCLYDVCYVCNVCYYCKCPFFSSCENYVGYKAYCFVCQIRKKCCYHDFELVTYQPVELIKLARKHFEDVSFHSKFNKNLTL